MTELFRACALLFTLCYLAGCQLDVEVYDKIPAAQISILKGKAMADGQDVVEFEVTLTNLRVGRPMPNVPINLLIDGKAPVGYSIECDDTDSQGKAICHVASSNWALVKVEVDLGQASSLKEIEGPSEIKEILFYDIYSYMQETTVGSATAFADSPLVPASISIFVISNLNTPIEGMTPIIEVKGNGATNHLCLPSDASGEAICTVFAETPGSYELISESPRLSDPLTLTFNSKTRSCTIPNAHAQELWGENNVPSWGLCNITHCHENYSLNGSGVCIADIRTCVPFPVGASNATQEWEQHQQNQWGSCLISACALNYNISDTAPGNSCIPFTRPVDPATLPPHAETAEETWNGDDWNPPYVTSCAYPYKAVAGACAPLDITPDAFVILDKTYQSLNEVIYSAEITLSGIETYVMAGISGDTSAFLEKLPSDGTDWIHFSPLFDNLKNGDKFRLGLVSSSNIATTSTVTYNIGVLGPFVWNVTTRDSNPPNGFALVHANNQNTFTLGWSIPGLANNPKTCHVDIQRNASTWTQLGTALDCDEVLPNTIFTLPATTNFSSYFNAAGIPVRIRRSDGIIVANLSQTLRCIPDPAIPAVDDPTRDENCNGNWTDDGDTQAPVGGSFTIVETSPVTSPLVHLAVICPTDLEGSPVYIAYGESALPTNWEPCRSNIGVTLSAGSGTKNIRARFKDDNGNMTIVQTATITYDNSAPLTDGGMVINNGNPYTNDPNVSLTVFCPTELDGDLAEMSIGTAANPGDPLNPADWEPCQLSKDFSLTATSGIKTLHIRFKGVADTLSNNSSASITLDAMAPTSSISYFDGWQTSTTLNVTVNHSDTLSGLDYCELQVAQAAISNTAVGSFSSWALLSSSCSTPIISGATGTAYKFRSRATDKAGNKSAWSEPTSILKINTDAPIAGSISYPNRIQVTTPMTIQVDRGTDPYSGMSAINSDYLLEVASAPLNPSTLSCGTFTAFSDASVSETALATSYDYTGTQGQCYKFQYRTRNAVGLTTTYSSAHVIKVNYTYDWDIGAYSSCQGGTGTWEYGDWGACTGGTGTWNYTSWTACTASCGGGSQSRTASCSINPGSALETRPAVCNKVDLSGQQFRTVNCLRSDATVVSDSFCSGVKAPTMSSCTPTSDSVCGVIQNTKACTNESVSVCGTQSPLTQACNTQLCCNKTIYKHGSNYCAGVVWHGTIGDVSRWNQQLAYERSLCASKSATISTYSMAEETGYIVRCN